MNKTQKAELLQVAQNTIDLNPDASMRRVVIEFLFDEFGADFDPSMNEGQIESLTLWVLENLED